MLQMQGWGLKKGRRTKHLKKRYFMLVDSVFSSRKAQGEAPSWEVVIVGGRTSFAETDIGTAITVTVDNDLYSFVPVSPKELKEWYSAFLDAVKERASDVYDLGEMLEHTGTAVVRTAYHKLDGTEVVVKTVTKNRNASSSVVTEREVAAEIDHPNLRKTHRIFDSKARFSLVQETLGGISLREKLQQDKLLMEKVAKEIMKQVLEAVAYMHGKGIVHRDIKPKNIHLVDTRFPFHVKISDFSFSKKIESIFDHTLTATVGTPYYIAPEMAKKAKYGAAVDVWACGVVLYYMLSGEMPFYGSDTVQVLDRVKAAELDMSSRKWQKVSSAGQQLVRSLLQVDPNKRLMARAALQHRWFSSAGMRMDHAKTAGHPLLAQKVRPILLALWAVYVFSRTGLEDEPIAARPTVTRVAPRVSRLRELNAKRGKSLSLRNRLTRTGVEEIMTQKLQATRDGTGAGGQHPNQGSVKSGEENPKQLELGSNLDFDKAPMDSERDLFVEPRSHGVEHLCTSKTAPSLSIRRQLNVKRATTEDGEMRSCSDLSPP